MAFTQPHDVRTDRSPFFCVVNSEFEIVELPAEPISSLDPGCSTHFAPSRYVSLKSGIHQRHDHCCSVARLRGNDAHMSLVVGNRYDRQRGRLILPIMLQTS